MCGQKSRVKRPLRTVSGRNLRLCAQVPTPWMGIVQGNRQSSGFKGELGVGCHIGKHRDNLDLLLGALGRC